MWISAWDGEDSSVISKIALNILLLFWTTYLYLHMKCDILNINKYQLWKTLKMNCQLFSQDLILYVKTDKHMISLMCTLAFVKLPNHVSAKGLLLKWVSLEFTIGTFLICSCNMCLYTWDPIKDALANRGHKVSGVCFQWVLKVSHLFALQVSAPWQNQ